MDLWKFVAVGLNDGKVAAHLSCICIFLHTDLFLTRVYYCNKMFLHNYAGVATYGLRIYDNINIEEYWPEGNPSAIAYTIGDSSRGGAPHGLGD